ncbi:MAG: enoyl-CoA hydratase/isomerase family protein [Alphaproteobacteria bacterium]|nr:enoyl-CoA hydratase/isomerase family protein [Alphaproteobacteria bacterium]
MSIDVNVTGHVVQVTINRPEAMNALDIVHNAELGAVWQRFNADADWRVAILTGAGEKAFCAGADLKSLIPAQRAAIARGDTTPWEFGGGLARGLAITKPIIAAVNGHCLAGGLEMALACDIRFCSPNAKLGLAEVKWAIIPGAGGTQRLPRAVPLGMALEMILSGDPIDAEEALRVGLVNRLVPQARLLPVAHELAARIAARGPLAVRAAKQAVYDGLGRDVAAGMAIEEALFNKVMASEDSIEGPLAFAERRPPQFKGR